MSNAAERFCDAWQKLPVPRSRASISELFDLHVGPIAKLADLAIGAWEYPIQHKPTCFKRKLLGKRRKCTCGLAELAARMEANSAELRKEKTP